jgi:hypothetical protein
LMAFPPLLMVVEVTDCHRVWHRGRQGYLLVAGQQ